jgi:hypothetical protein
MVAERRKKTKAMVRQQAHRREFWWTRLAADRAAHLDECESCKTWLFKRLRH